MIAFCHLPENQLSIVRLTGQVEFAEVLRYLKSRFDAATEPRPGSQDSLIDLRELENTHNYEEVSQLSDLLRAKVPAWDRKRIAFLVNRDAHYGVGRMFSLVMSVRTDANISIFRTIEEASAWLGLPLGELLAGIKPEQWRRPPAG